MRKYSGVLIVIVGAVEMGIVQEFREECLLTQSLPVHYSDCLLVMNADS